MFLYVYTHVFIDHMIYLLCLSSHIEAFFLLISIIALSFHFHSNDFLPSQRGYLLSVRVFSTSGDRNPESLGSHIKVIFSHKGKSRSRADFRSGWYISSAISQRSCSFFSYKEFPTILPLCFSLALVRSMSILVTSREHEVIMIDMLWSIMPRENECWYSISSFSANCKILYSQGWGKGWKNLTFLRTVFENLFHSSYILSVILSTPMAELPPLCVIVSTLYIEPKISVDFSIYTYNFFLEKSTWSCQ